jgi:hypothetical protein
MRLSDSSSGVYVPVLRPVGRVAITVAVLCAVMALSMDVWAFSLWRKSIFPCRGEPACPSSVVTEPVKVTCTVEPPLRAPPPPPVDETLVMTTRASLLTWVFAWLAAAFVVLLWIWRARANAEVLSPVPPRLSRWWSVGCWFVPIVNLVLPPRVLVDIWAASCAGRDSRDGYVPSIRLVRAWWVAQWTCVVLVVLFVLVGARVVGIDGYSVADQPEVLAVLLAVVVHGAAVLFAAIVLRISADQTRAMNMYRRLACRSCGRAGI